MPEPRGRMLLLLSLLQTGRAWAGVDLARRLDTSPRTLRRDVERLRDLGYPVRTRPGPGGYYQLVGGTALPPLLLDEDEAVALAVGLRLAEHDQRDESAARALRKLERALPSRLRHRVSAVQEATETSGRNGTPVDTHLLGLVSAAVQRRERLAFTYRALDGPETTRRVEPYRQILNHHRWYLLAWDLDRGDWRTFRLDRMTEVGTTGHPFVPRPLPASSGAEYLDAQLRVRRHRAVITLQAPLQEVAPRLSHRDVELAPVDEHACRLTAWVDSFEWLAVVTLTLNLEFCIEEPAAFADYCRQLRDRLARATP